MRKKNIYIVLDYLICGVFIKSINFLMMKKINEND